MRLFLLSPRKRCKRRLRKAECLGLATKRQPQVAFWRSFDLSIREAISPPPLCPRMSSLIFFGLDKCRDIRPFMLPFQLRSLVGVRGQATDNFQVMRVKELRSRN